MQGNSALLQMKSNKDIKGCALNTNALERHISWTGHPMDILWTPYGHPMDTLWTSYGHPMDILWGYNKAKNIPVDVSDGCSPSQN